MADNVRHNITKNYTNLKRQRARKEFCIQIIGTVREGICMPSFSKKRTHEIYCYQSDRVGEKSPIVDVFSLAAPQM